MSFGGTYSTGTVSTDTGSPVNERALIFSGSLLGPNVEQGDMFWAAGAIGFISSIDDDTHITLYSDWTGPALDDADYVIFKTSWLRVDAAITQEKTRQLLAALDAQGIILFVAGDVPDPGMGEDGQWALKTNGGPWKLWLKVSGVWVLQGVPVGTTFRGAWDSATAYNANDLTSRFGTTYGALVPNTNIDPATDDGSHWVVFASRGIDGGQGGGCAWVQTFSTSTANSDPGDGLLRLNNLTQGSATVIRIDYLDINGGSIASLIASMAAGTSPVKGSIRISERSDLARWMTANVTAVQDMTGYFNVTVTVTRAPDEDKLLRDAQPIVVQFTPKGDLGNTGNTGAQGNAGWSPVFSLVSDSDRRVLKIVDWAGGAGTKPAINKYVGGSGLVDAVGDGLDIRGGQGLKGDKGDQGQGIQPDATGSLTDRATHDAAAAGYIFMQTDVTPFVLYVKNSATSGDWSDGSSLGSGTVVASDVTNDSDVTGATVTDALNDLDDNKADLVSPSLTGTPLAPTAAVDTNTTQIATTAFVIGQASASGDGTPAADGTASRGTSKHYARADHVHPTDASRAPASNIALSALAAQADGTVVGNVSGSSSTPSALTMAQITAALLAMVGDTGSGGAKGLVPAPAAGDAAAGKYLKADGTFAVPPGTGGGGGGGSGSNYVNRIINPFGAMWQRNNTGAAAIGDAAYAFDQWYGLRQTSNLTASLVANPENGSPSMMRLSQPSGTAQRFGIAQAIESANIIDARGQSVTLSARVRMSVATTLRYAILAYAGTADTPTKDVVNNWTSTNFTTGNFFISTSMTLVAAGSTALSANTLAGISLTGTVPGTMNNLIVIFWTDSTQAQNVTLDVGKVQLELAAAATTFSPRSVQEETILCQRYYAISPSYSGGWGATTTSATFTAVFPVAMRTAPTMALVNGSVNGGSALEISVAQHVVSAISAYVLNQYGGRFDVDTTAAASTQRPAILEAGAVSFSAEL